MAKQFRRVTRTVRMRPKLKAMRAHIHREYARDIAALEATISEQILIASELRLALTDERSIGLRAHLRLWWREGPWPRRWRIFLSTP